MMTRLGATLCMAGALVLSGCGDIVIGDRGAGSGGGSTGSGGSAGTAGGSTGTVAACPTGNGLGAFGASPGGATIGIAADASGVYWSNDDGSVWKAGSAGVAPHVIAGAIGKDLYTLALGAGAVYVADYGGALWKLGKDGSSPLVLATAPSGVTAVAVDDSGVYFSSVDGVRRVDPQGGAAQLLVAVDDADSLAVDEGFVYVRTVGNVGDPTNRVLAVPKAGGAPLDIAPPEPGPLHYFSQEIAVDATSVYWANASLGTVSKVPKAGGVPVVLAEGLPTPVSVAVDGGFVYVTVLGKDGGPATEHGVAKVPAAGGPVTYVAQGGNVSAYGIALDATRAYWTQKVVGGAVGTACK